MPRGYEPSPRRLRSRGDRSQDGTVTTVAARHLPDRTAKPKMGDLQEDDSESDSGGSDNDGVPASSAVDSDREEVSDEEEDDEDEETVEESPRKLRNGKVVPRDDPKSDEDDDADTEVGGSEISEEDADASADPEYMEEDEEIVDNAVVNDAEDSTNEDDEVDLSEETMKTLVRYRRDELLRLCESRSLHVEGTKPQLAKALLEWVCLPF